MALQIERRPRARRRGRPYIGPRIQVAIPEEYHDWAVREHKLRGLTEEQWPELLREIFCAGVEALNRGRVPARARR